MNKIKINIGRDNILDLNCINLHKINPYLFEFEGRHSIVYHTNGLQDIM